MTIAGSDSGGGAGVQADLKTFAAHRVHGMSVVTAVTAQNSHGVLAVQAVTPQLVRAQLEAVLDDFGADAVKIGMLGGGAVVKTVGETLRARWRGPLVLDPVVRASAGGRLLTAAGLRLLQGRLLPLATVVTPNLDEAALLTGESVASVAEMRRAAKRLRDMGARAVVVTGGHLAGDAVDVVMVGNRVHELRGRRIGGAAVHGTGCTFAAALAAALAKGARVLEGAESAKRYTARCVRRARALGAGQRVLGHFA